MGTFYRFWFIALLCAPLAASAQLLDPQGPMWPPPAPFDARQGIIQLDVAVTAPSGAPIVGLVQQDLTLLDSNQPQKLVTFAAFDGVTSFSQPAAQLILVIDQLHIDPLDLPAVERAIKTFLLKDNGHLEQPTLIYRLSAKGLFASSFPSVNGPDLAKEIDSGQEPRAVRSLADAPKGSFCAAVVARQMSSPETIGAIVLEQRQTPGRKVMVWIGPGWGKDAPSCGPGISLKEPYDWVTEFSTRMREARIALYALDPWGSPGLLPFDYRHYTGGATPKQMHPARLSLQVLALNSGGQVVLDKNLEKEIDRIAEYARVFYTLTWDPPRAAGVDEYHSLQVRVSAAGAAASTWTGYYDEPSFYDQPPPFEPVTAAQLESRLQELEAMRDAKAAEQLSKLQLTERLSPPRLTEWEKRFRNRERTLRALEVLADLSAFLPLPAAEIPPIPAPSLDEQRAIMARTVNYLTHTIPTLPDFFAQRTIAPFAEVQPKSQTWKEFNGDGHLGESRPLRETVHYRNGREDVEAEDISIEDLLNRKEQERLDAVGTFGAILNIVIPDAARSDLQWSRWEQSARGLRAVFRFSVPAAKSHYHLSYCCVDNRSGPGIDLPIEQISWTSAYHGELMVDASSGEILRVTLQADLERLPLNRADLMVAYAPARIGDRTYLCPVHSVAIVRERTRMRLKEWGGSIQAFGPFRTMLNDITYSRYRKFGTTMKILPGFTEAPQ
jgi:VWFA-related protein